jgi:hypothetical protein
MVKCLILFLVLAVMAHSAPGQEFKLEYQKVGFNLSISINTRDSDEKFEKEPDFDNRPIVRGLIPTGKKKEDHIGFAWDKNEAKLYLDLNRNRDLTDDSEGIFECTGDRGYQTFTNINLTVPSDSVQLKYKVHMAIYSYGKNRTNCNLTVNSGFKSEIELYEKKWKLAVADNMDGTIGNGDHIFIIPLADSNGIGRMNSQFSLPVRDLTVFGGRTYNTSFELKSDEKAPSLLASFTETDGTMGQLKLEGKFIKRLVLTSDSSLVVLDSPGETVWLPVGEYVCKNLFLDGGKGKIFTADVNRNRPDSFLVSEDTPATLKMGGPLNNTVTVQRTGNNLNLSYKLTGAGGHQYSSMNGRSDKPPTFSVKKDGKEIASGKFEYG